MQQEKPIIYSFVRCPWAMRARLALCYMEIDYVTREIDLKNKPATFLETSPKGTVPVLMLEDGTIIDESLDVVLWAMPKPKDDEFVEMMNLITENDTDFKFNNYNYKYPERYAEDMLTQVDHRLAAEKFISKLEGMLSKQQYLFKDEISIADIAIFPLVRQFSKVDEEWFAASNYVAVRNWLQTITDSAFFAKAMQKYPLFTG